VKPQVSIGGKRFGFKSQNNPSIITAGFREEPRSPKHTP